MRSPEPAALFALTESGPVHAGRARAPRRALYRVRRASASSPNDATERSAGGKASAKGIPGRATKAVAMPTAFAPARSQSWGDNVGMGAKRTHGSSQHVEGVGWQRLALGLGHRTKCRSGQGGEVDVLAGSRRCHRRLQQAREPGVKGPLTFEDLVHGHPDRLKVKRRFVDVEDRCSFHGLFLADLSSNPPGSVPIGAAHRNCWELYTSRVENSQQFRKVGELEALARRHRADDFISWATGWCVGCCTCFLGVRRRYGRSNRRQGPG